MDRAMVMFALLPALIVGYRVVWLHTSVTGPLTFDVLLKLLLNVLIDYNSSFLNI